LGFFYFGLGISAEGRLWWANRIAWRHPRSLAGRIILARQLSENMSLVVFGHGTEERACFHVFIIVKIAIAAVFI
jgi:hypothetical protein